MTIDMLCGRSTGRIKRIVLYASVCPSQSVCPVRASN